MKVKKMTKRICSMLLALVMVLTVVLVAPVAAEAATTTKPSNSTTTGAPFIKGTGGSNSFRIPALVTLSDGTLVAAADARWNTTYDGGGLDTIVSCSYDDGVTWNYTFANYLGDNGNTYSGSGSTAFIDPALAVTADDTIYMLVDLYPYGVALNGSGNTAPVTKKGFDSNGRLLLSSNNHSSYGYYLENGKIYSSSGSVVSGYTVDDHFNITGNGYNTNLFFSDSPYKVVRTGFLYLTKSTDKGATWSAPQLLDLKTSSEKVCLVGPGRGLVTANGTIVFPVYSYNGSQDTQKMGFIYSTDGVNWKRSANFSYSWASESAVVELADGTLRFFFRNGTTNLCYVDYNMSTNAWGSAVNTGLDTNSNCQISAITYSKTSDGKQVLLVSCPTGPNEAGSNQSGASYRLNGKIFVGVVGDNNTMSWKNSISVTANNSQFMYSCLTELSDGSVAILYENLENAWGAGSNCYYTMAYKTYNADALGVTFDAAKHEYTAVTVEPTCETAGYTSYTCTDCGDSYTEEIPALGHNYETVTVDATCETAGSVTTTCVTCGDEIVEEIPALGHDYETVTVEATCETAGSVTTTCANCGDKTVETVSALGHSYESVVTAPTCDKAGYTTYSCANCGDSYVADEIAALGHSYEAETVEATCVTDGGTVYTCTTCGHSYTADKVAAFGHNYTTTTVDATCETAGSVTKTCANCGDSSKETIPALGHDYKTVTVAATCETAGSVTKTCAACGDSSKETIPALGHNYKTTTVAATCEAAGSVTKTCATCGDTTQETIPALGHNYQTTTVEATCEVAGSVTTACANCGDKTVETIPALGHSYTSTTVAPTCTAGGYTLYTCGNCGDSYTSNQTAALGHNYTSQQVGNDMVYTCTNCGHSYSESLAKIYTYDKVTAFASGESYVITLYSNRKYYAVTHSNNTLSVQQVTVSGNQITSEITDDMLWTYNSGKLSYTSGNNTFYLYAKTSGGWFGWGGSTTLSLSTSNSSTVTFSGNRLKVGSYYLRYSYGSVSLNRSATTSYLFQQNEQ